MYMLFMGTRKQTQRDFSLTFSLTFLAVGQLFELNLFAKKKKSVPLDSQIRQVKSSLQLINLPSALPLM